jgi:hypothetical protein
VSNRTKLTQEKRAEFLEEVATHANVTRAALKIGMARTYLYTARKEDESFFAEWKAAEEIGLDACEDEVTRRAVEGYDEPVFYQGEVCGTIRKYSDSLLMFKLNGGRPEKYRRQLVTAEISGAGGGPIKTINAELANTSDPHVAAQLYTALLGAPDERGA